MAQMPTIASTASRRLLPQADLRIEGGTPAAFGGAIGAGLQSVGEAGQELGNSIANLELIRQREADQMAEFDRQAQFVNFSSGEASRLDEAQRDISGPAQDFTKNFMSTFDDQSKQFLANVPERHRAQWQARFGQLRGAMAGQALKTEFAQRDAWSNSTLGDTLTQLQNGIGQNPDAFEGFRTQGEQLIDSSLLSPQAKEEKKQAWRVASTLAAATGDINRDPEGALKRLGGIDPVTADEARAAAAGGVSGTGMDYKGPVEVKDFGKLLGALVQQESGGKRGISGPATKYGTAHGLTQVLDSTGAELASKLGIAWRPDLMRGSSDEAAAYQTTIGGAYLKEGLKKYDGDVRKALMFYHGGPDEKKWGPKTRAYASAVLGRLPASEVVSTAPATPAAGAPGADPLAPMSDPAVAAEQPTDAPPVDARYADLPFSARQQLIGAAQREIATRQGVAEAAKTAEHGAWLNSFLIDLADGKAGAADIQAAREAGKLTDYGEIEKANNIVASKTKTDDDLVRFNSKTAAGEEFNMFDDDDKHAVEAGVKAMGDTPLAAFTVWQKTGVLSKKGTSFLRGSMASTNPTVVAQGVSMASNMLEQNPNAFASVEGGDDIERNALLYRHYVSDLGMSREEAVQKVAQQNTPEQRHKIDTSKEALKGFRKKVLAKSDVAGWLSDQFDNSWFGANPGFVGPEQKRIAEQDYADIASDYFVAHGDERAAESYAQAQIKKMYGVVNGRLMKFPPTKAYPAIEGGHNYIFNQAAKDVAQATGRSINGADIYLMPVPTATSEAFRSGKPVPYEVHYVDRSGDQPVYRMLHGQAFVADVAAAQREARQRNHDAFTAKRDKKTTRSGGW